jgi:excisionase family DNA binding protein
MRPILVKTISHLQSLIGVNQGAKRLGVSPLTLRRAIKDGEIACVRIRRRVLIPFTEILRIEQGKTKPESR